MAIKPSFPTAPEKREIPLSPISPSRQAPAFSRRAPRPEENASPSTTGLSKSKGFSIKLRPIRPDGLPPKDPRSRPPAPDKGVVAKSAGLKYNNRGRRKVDVDRRRQHVRTEVPAEFCQNFTFYFFVFLIKIGYYFLKIYSEGIRSPKKF